LDALSELIFVDPGAKINEQYYRDVLRQNLLPGIRRVSGNMLTFQKTVPQRIVHGTRLSCCVADMWPPNSPDLNPVDYAVWSIMQQRVYQTRVYDIDELRQHLITVWCGLEQRAVDDAIDQ